MPSQRLSKLLLKRFLPWALILLLAALQLQPDPVCYSFVADSMNEDYTASHEQIFCYHYLHSNNYTNIYRTTQFFDLEILVTVLSLC